MSFSKIADFYYLLFDETTRLDREGPFLIEILNRTSYKPKVLDLACGTGPHARFLADKAECIIALDISAEMLIWARMQTQHRNVHFVRGDLEHLPFDEKWDVILCLGNSLCLLPSRESIRSFFHQVKHLLAKNGIFLVQILNYSHPEIQQINTRYVNKDIHNKSITLVKTLTPSERYIFLSISYFVTSDKGHEAVSEASILQKVSSEDLIEYAEGVGLHVMQIFGDFQKNAFDLTTSKDLIMVFSDK